MAKRGKSRPPKVRVVERDDALDAAAWAAYDAAQPEVKKKLNLIAERYKKHWPWEGEPPPLGD